MFVSSLSLSLLPSLDSVRSVIRFVRASALFELNACQQHFNSRLLVSGSGWGEGGQGV